MDFLKSLKDDELVQYYSAIIKEMKEREIIRSNNVVGDLGEYYAIDYYCKTPGLPKLQMAPPATQNIDAISINGERYSIKCSTNNVGSVFYGLNPPSSTEAEKPKFEYVLIVLLDENFALKRINEVTWEEFLQHKKWHSRMAAWNLPVTKKLLASTRTIYSREEAE